ncbi:hypothetical protein RIF29_14799 [Crotalaria pallida]|uniref:Uncharacterized protein n=1 Tax=Crotalaria pallida TaxID=3830 RepID=A0AAN9FG47_CROPI
MKEFMNAAGFAAAAALLPWFVQTDAVPVLSSKSRSSSVEPPPPLLSSFTFGDKSPFTQQNLQEDVLDRVEEAARIQSINYVAISEALGMSASVLAAVVAADNVICVVYFMVLFALASKIPPEAAAPMTNDAMDMESDYEGNLPVLQTATALATSFLICKAATYLTKLYGIQGGTLPGVTAIVVILATLLPKQIGSLGFAGHTVALILLQVFFVVVGASGSIWNVINTAPSIFMFALVQITIHLVLVLGLGKLLKLDLKLLRLASNANIGGPTTACGMAKAKVLPLLPGGSRSPLIYRLHHFSLILYARCVMS